jgi:hypothetical protein
MQFAHVRGNTTSGQFFIATDRVVKWSINGGICNEINTMRHRKNSVTMTLTYLVYIFASILPNLDIDTQLYIGK